jgi:DNA-3-methyladenine glycosylase
MPLESLEPREPSPSVAEAPLEVSDRSDRSDVTAPTELRDGRLPRAWYGRDALVVARSLIGCLLVHEDSSGGRTRVARIVETEAYRGPKDLACHARAGLTRRTRTLLGEEGHAYVYFVYGMHDLLNATCGGSGRGHAVLIRAAEPLRGFEGFETGARLDGPGRLTRGMGVTRALDGHDLTRPPLYICARPREFRSKPPKLAVSPRVGVAYSGEWADRPWRFYDAASRHVSRPPKSAIGRPTSPCR